MIKVLLVSPCNFTTSSELLTIPIGLAYIKSYCEAQIDCQISIVPSIKKNILIKERPDIVGISCYAATYGKAAEIAKVCKQHGVFTVVGGEQITTLPHRITKDMDVGVRGEGEYVFLSLLNHFDNGWDKVHLRKINGLVFHSDGHLEYTPLKKEAVELDSLPIPDLLYGNRNTDILCLMSSRGCPFRCSYCATGWHKDVHWLSPEKVVQTIEYHIKKYPQIRRIKFWDDLFTVKQSRVEAITDMLEQKGLTKNLSYFICTRSDHINEPLLKVLKRMNCNHVSMGLESGCHNTLKYVQKGTTPEQNRNAVELLSHHGFNSEASFIIGFPEETNEDIIETYNFIKSISVNKIQIFLPIPYPGTRIWDYAMEKDLVSETMDWEKLDLIATMNEPKKVLSDFVVISEELSRQELYTWLIRFKRLRLRKTLFFALKLLSTDPVVIWQRIKREVRFFVHRLNNS